MEIQGDQINESVGYSKTSGVVYTVSNTRKSSWTFITQLRGHEPNDMNIVGISELDGKEVIYKVPRLPSFSIFSEYRACKAIKDIIPSVKHFSRSLFITKMALKCDKQNLCLPRYPDGSRNEPWRTCDVLVQKKVPGDSFSEKMASEHSYRMLFSVVYQVLCALHSVQTWLQYTHYDLHPGNVKLKPMKEEVYQLFDTVDEPEQPFAVYGKYKAVIIDNEFSHVCTMDGNPLDSFMGHLKHLYDPTSSDSSIDVLRFLVCTFGYHFTLYKNSQLIGDLAHSLMDMFNKNSTKGVINEIGIIGELDHQSGKWTEMKDPIHKGIMQHFNIPEEKEFVNKYLYHIIELLSHKIRLPLEKKVENPDTSFILDVIKLLLVKCHHPEYRIRILFEIVSNKNQSDIYAIISQLKVNIPNFNTWYHQIKSAIDSCLPHLETALYFTTLEVKNMRTQQRESEFTPKKMIQWLNTKYVLFRPVDHASIVYWMTKSKRYKVSLKSCTQKQLNYINEMKNDMYAFSARLKEVVQQIHRLQTHF
jgi:hypothetical protein